MRLDEAIETMTEILTDHVVPERPLVVETRDEDGVVTLRCVDSVSYDGDVVRLVAT